MKTSTEDQEDNDEEKLEWWHKLLFDGGK